jgi:parvulin-like peptidyl-prolyl isomerase
MRICLLLLLLWTPVLVSAQVVVDRVVAVVNDRVITLSDWRTEESYEAMLQGRPPDKVELSEDSLRRLMDRMLVLQQFKTLNFQGITPEQVDRHVKEVRAQIQGAETEDGWNQLLSSYGLTATEVRQLVEEQFNFLRFIEARFRPSVQVPDAEVENYYRNEFLPQLARQGVDASKAPPLSDVRSRIERILSEGKIDELLDSWLQNLRSRGNVHRVPPLGESETATDGSKQ